MSMKWLDVPRAGLMTSAFLIVGALAAMGFSGAIPPEMEGARRIAELAADKDLITLALWVAVLSIASNVMLVRWALVQTMRQTAVMEKMASRPCMAEEGAGRRARGAGQ